MSEGRPDQRLAVIEDGGEISGFFGFERSRWGIGRAFCYGLSDVQGIVHAPGYEWNGVALLEACELDVWNFDHLIADQVQCFAPGRWTTYRASPIVDLSAGWESWIARKKSNQRIKDIQRRERKLVREIGTPRFETDTNDMSHLDLLMQWKSAQYRRTGRFDRFAQMWVRNGIKRLLDMRRDGFSTELSVMFVRDRPASFHLALRFDDMLASWFPAYDVNLATFGVGIVHQLHVLRHASQRGVRFFDFGAGEESYKRTFSDFDLFVAEGSLSRASAVALTHRMQTVPKRIVTDFVLRRPPLRRAARRVLNVIGSVRCLLHSRAQSRGADGRR